MTNRELFWFLNGLARSLTGVTEEGRERSSAESNAYAAGKLAPRFARVAAEAVMSTAGLTLGFGQGVDTAQVDDAFARAQGKYAEDSEEWRMLDALRRAWQERAESAAAAGAAPPGAGSLS